MNSTLSITPTFLLVLIIGTIILFTRSANWIEVNAVVRQSEIEEIYLNPNASMDANRGSFDYKLLLEYEYTYKGKSYIGTAIYPDMPNIFSEETLALEMQHKYKVEAEVIAYVDTKAPSIAALETANTIGVKKLLIFGLLLIVIIGFIIGGIFVFQKL